MKKFLELILTGVLFLPGCALDVSFTREMSDREWQEHILLYSYKEDKEGFWQSPKTTIKRKEGDCEDFATLSAFYSGNRYGDNILVLAGEDKTGKAVYHVFHLLIENGKVGCRGYHGDNFPAEYSLKELVNEIQERKKSIEFRKLIIVNLDEMNKDWRATERDLSPDYLRLLNDEKARIIFVEDLR